MTSFKEALESAGVKIGLEGGRFSATDANGNEVKQLGNWLVAHTNTGPDVRLDGEKLAVTGLSDEAPFQEIAIYDPNARQWS